MARLKEFVLGPARTRGAEVKTESHFAVGIANGEVLLDFGTSLTWLAMPGETALELGRLLIRNGQALCKHEFVDSNACLKCGWIVDPSDIRKIADAAKG